MAQHFKPSAAAQMGLYDSSGDRLYINDEERERFLQAAKRSEYPKRQFGLLLALTGCRLSEGRGFRWDDLQVAGQRVALRTLKRRCGTPTREVPVSPLLVEELLAIYHRVNANGGLWQADGRDLPRRTAYRWIKELMVDAGILGKRACPKGLRHGFAAWAVLSGVPVTTLQKWMGHASLETTMIYATLCGPDEIALAARMWQAQGLLGRNERKAHARGN